MDQTPHPHLPYPPPTPQLPSPAIPDAHLFEFMSAKVRKLNFSPVSERNYRIPCKYWYGPVTFPLPPPSPLLTLSLTVRALDQISNQIDRKIYAGKIPRWILYGYVYTENFRFSEVESEKKTPLTPRVFFPR